MHSKAVRKYKCPCAGTSSKVIKGDLLYLRLDGGVGSYDSLCHNDIHNSTLVPNKINKWKNQHD